MNKIFNLFFIALISFSTIEVSAQAQSNRWESAIVKFEENDRINPPKEKDLIVFAGSSSIVIWKDIKSYFPEKNIINRGFGGSQTSDLIQYLDRIVTKYNPKQVFIYEGENDIADGRKSAEQVLNDFKIVFSKLRAHDKKINIVFISIKPSPIRVKYTNEILKANELVKTFISSQKNALYVDIYSKMLDKDGKIRPELYKEDNLHMKPEGYVIWNAAIKPYLK